MILQILSLGPWGIIKTAVDIVIVAYAFYRILLLIRGTRAMQLVKGILFLMIATQAAAILNLVTTHLVLQTAQVALLVALPVVFQPELRRALEQLGRARVFGGATLQPAVPEEVLHRVSEEIVRAAAQLSHLRFGAIIVIERTTGLKEYIETGVRTDADVSWELLVNMFTPNTPLHDGAVVVRGDRIVAAACFLPLAESTVLPTEFGTRHRAAVGITEQTDAMAVVVSEETGTISLAEGGRLIRHLDDTTLKETLGSIYSRPKPSRPYLLRGGRFG